VVFFEPWSLGDVIIAAAAARELDTPVTLACHPDWHPIIHAMWNSEPKLELLAVTLPYTTRTRLHPFDKSEFSQTTHPEVTDVLSIRGDPRDYSAARHLFPQARIRMKGWIRFFARKNSLADLPYRFGWRPVENRYRAWATLAGGSFEQLELTYIQKQETAPKNGRIVIHVGAQWRSKQYPHVAELSTLPKKRNYEVILAASNNDTLPDAVSETNVQRKENGDLVALFQSAQYVITNDSGPMHLAAFIGCRTTALVRAASIEEWLPPATRVIAAPETPRGYRQRWDYMTDIILPGWPSAAEVASCLGL
jgi:hypothetical protein